jgi:hypothetical protein
MLRCSTLVPLERPTLQCCPSFLLIGTLIIYHVTYTSHGPCPSHIHVKKLNYQCYIIVIEKMLTLSLLSNRDINTQLVVGNTCTSYSREMPFQDEAALDHVDLLDGECFDMVTGGTGPLRFWGVRGRNVVSKYGVNVQMPYATKANQMTAIMSLKDEGCVIAGDSMGFLRKWRGANDWTNLDGSSYNEVYTYIYMYICM